MKLSSDIDKRLNVFNFQVYGDPIIKKAVNLYFKSKENKYDLFSIYIIGTNFIMDDIKNGKINDLSWIKNYKRFKDTILLKNGSINFRNPLIKYRSKMWSYLYVGKIERDGQMMDLFLSISDYDNEPRITGFSIDSGDEKYFFKWDPKYIKKVGKINESFNPIWYDDLKEHLS